MPKREVIVMTTEKVHYCRACKAKLIARPQLKRSKSGKTMFAVYVCALCGLRQRKVLERGHSGGQAASWRTRPARAGKVTVRNVADLPAAERARHGL